VASERERLRQFLAGEPDESDRPRAWLDMIRAATAEGRCFMRVRVVSLPLTDYSRYGLWSAQFTNAAGEDIRYLPRDQAQAEGLPDYDWWLFDSRKLAPMTFDDDDRFLGAEIIEDPAVVVRHCYWRDAAWHRAILRDEFATRVE
jgi:Family of unknown function (DUF6879)